MKDEYWTKRHGVYSETDWISKPNMFAETVKTYLPSVGKILDLGAGLGQDSAFFSGLGYEVTSTDLTIDKLTEFAGDKFAVKQVDLRQPLPFDDASFDVVYAHLSLHYFDKRTTEAIFDEIYRVLKPGGLLAFFTNSTADPDYGEGTKLEDNYFDAGGIAKRYLDIDAAKQFAHKFKPIIADNEGETYKDSAKGVHNLIRFIGTKK